MSNSQLRQIIVCGPEWKAGEPFWELTAAAPDAFFKSQGYIQEDHVHPIRTLTIDAVDDERENGFRHPHLVSIHLLVGHGEGKYQTQCSEKVFATVKASELYIPPGFEPLNLAKNDKINIYGIHERLKVRASFESRSLVQYIPSRLKWAKSSLGWILNKKDKEHYTAAYFLSGPVGKPDTPKTPAAASFQHIIARPFKPENPWPGQVKDAIEVPAFSLVTGSIQLAVADKSFNWLGDLQPTPDRAVEALAGIHRYPLILTPDGMELETFVDFPNTGKIKGWFLLAPSNGRLTLTLLPAKLDEKQRKNWQAAWQKILSKDESVDELSGIRLEGNLGAIPEFRWTLEVEEVMRNSGFGPGFRIISETSKLPVEIPAQYLRLDLLSPVSSGVTNGVINCTGGYFYLGRADNLQPHSHAFFDHPTYKQFKKDIPVDDALVLAWVSSKNQQNTTALTYLEMLAEPKNVTVRLIAPASYPCSFDERNLAASLRKAYGIAPLAQGDQYDLTSLAGFTPVTDGWLQIPFANLPPLDTSSDRDMLTNPPAPKINVLDGFLRFAHQPDAPLIQSAYNKSDSSSSLVKEAPWSVTLEGAVNLSVAVALSSAKPVRALALADDPDIATRGLLWLSIDRPDSLEAIPRLGAGPGAYIDVPLERWEESTSHINVAIDSLIITAKDENSKTVVSRDQLKLSLEKAPKILVWPTPIHWARHPFMPLAAQMPMTRAALSAVRPLESQDLFPLELSPLNKRSTLLAELLWEKQAAFPQLTGEFGHRLSKDWPLPNLQVIGDNNEMNVRGIEIVPIGVPGAVLALKKDQTPWALNDPWPFMAALRWDQAALDAAFAIATVPPVDEYLGISAPSAESTIDATAVDWEALVKFWQEQERRVQLCRVTHSYVANYKAIDDFTTSSVSSLVGGFTWKPECLGFGHPLVDPSKKDLLPYGYLKLGKDQELNGNLALEGLTENFTITDTNKLVQDPKGAIQVLGNSPGFFEHEGYLLDSRGSGIGQLNVTAGWWQPVKHYGATRKISGRFTCPNMIPVISSSDQNFQFWFKDIPLTKEGTLGVFQGEKSINANAWQDDQIQSTGYEWRFLASDADKGLGNGEYWLPFMGFVLEPLRLTFLSVPVDNNGVPTSKIPDVVKILARLHLGIQTEDVPDGGNLITIILRNSLQQLSLDNIEASEPLHFPFNIDYQRVMVKAESALWNKDTRIFSLKNPAIIFEFMDREIILKKDVISVTQGNLVQFSWSQKELKSVAGTIEVKTAKLSIDKKVEFNFGYQVAIAPGEDQGVPTIIVDASGGLTEAHEGIFNLLGSSVKVNVILSRNSLCIASANDAILNNPLLEGFPEQGQISFGLMVAVNEFKEETYATISSGVLSGSIQYNTVQTFIDRGETFKLEYVLVNAESNRRDQASQLSKTSSWTGSLSLFGTVGGQSAIAWPEINPTQDQDTKIPFPPASKSGRNSIKINDNNTYHHQIEWILDGHTLPLATAGYIHQGNAQKGIWTANAMAKHTLTSKTDDKKTFQFRSVDTFVMGVVAALIPSWSDSENEKKTRSTFAARYNDTNPLIDHNPDPGMNWPGRGGLGAVLQGTWSSTFRNDFRDAHNNVKDLDKKIILAGGFLGLISQKNVDATPLLRLPVLIGLSKDIFPANKGSPLLSQVGGTDKSIELAWPDSLASVPVTTTFRSAITSATPSESDLETAISMGAKSLFSFSDEWTRISGSLLVEQSFPVGLSGGNISTTPYFLASASAISRLIKTVEQEPNPADSFSRTMSFISPTFSRSGKDPENNEWRKVAVLLSKNESPKQKKLFSPEIKPRLFSIGDDLVIWDWPGLNLAQVPIDTLNGQAAIKAYKFHARPKAAIICDTVGSFCVITLPVPKIKPRKRMILPQAFSDPGRGYKLPALENNAMAGIKQGSVQAVRDPNSGIAGLSYVATLPALAGEVINSNKNTLVPALKGMLWLSQQRNPIYLPLQSKLQSEPIPYLVPGSPLARVPLAEEVLCRLPQGDWQLIVAEQVMSASVSERPGISMANQMRLEISASESGVFDPEFPKFGQAAQTSLSVTRTVRTPRPGKLPENTDDALRNRRPCVSPLLPKQNHSAWVGPADTIRGIAEANDERFSWSITFIASPETAGIVTSSWDGSIRLSAEIDEQRKTCPKNWVAELVSLVLDLETTEQNTSLNIFANLVINGRVLPYKSLRFEKNENCKSPDGVYRGRVCIVLDMRTVAENVNAPGAALGEIEQLLSNSFSIPAIELQLTLFPRDKLSQAQVKFDEPFKLAEAVNQSLPGGASRNPVTLRFPLWPIMRGGGALALEPSTLIFTDPAYNAGLSSPPYEELVRVKGNNVPQDRGALYFFLSADRRRINCKSSVILMTDLRFEKKLDKSKLDPTYAADFELRKENKLNIKFAIQPRTGERRSLLFKNNSKSLEGSSLTLGYVHELSLSSLTEIDGSTAALQAGDILEITVESLENFPVNLLNLSGKSEVMLQGLQEAVTLRLILTNEPVVEPPPGLYAALVREKSKELPAGSLALPLYAQSPLPWRVDLENAAADFRAGLIHRNATFVWTLARPFQKRNLSAVHIIKMDRNGQTYIPENVGDFSEVKNVQI